MTYTLIVAIIYGTGGWGNNATQFHMERGYPTEEACKKGAKQYLGFQDMGSHRTRIDVEWKCVEQ